MALLEGQKFTDSMVTGLIIFDPRQNKIIELNKAAAKIIGGNTIGESSQSLSNKPTLVKLLERISEAEFLEKLESSSLKYKRLELNLNSQYYNAFISQIPDENSLLIEICPSIQRDINQTS